MRRDEFSTEGAEPEVALRGLAAQIKPEDIAIEPIEAAVAQFGEARSQIQAADHEQQDDLAKARHRRREPLPPGQQRLAASSLLSSSPRRQQQPIERPRRRARHHREGNDQLTADHRGVVEKTPARDHAIIGDEADRDDGEREPCAKADHRTDAGCRQHAREQVCRCRRHRPQPKGGQRFDDVRGMQQGQRVHVEVPAQMAPDIAEAFEQQPQHKQHPQDRREQRCPRCQQLRQQRHCGTSSAKTKRACITS